MEEGDVVRQASLFAFGCHIQLRIREPDITLHGDGDTAADLHALDARSSV